MREAGVHTGLCHLFVHNTSASLNICEDADPTVFSDLSRFMARLAPDGDVIYDHTLDDPGDIPVHVRSISTKTACGGAIWIIVCIEDAEAIKKILTHLAKATAPEATRQPPCQARPQCGLLD